MKPEKIKVGQRWVYNNKVGDSVAHFIVEVINLEKIESKIISVIEYCPYSLKVGSIRYVYSFSDSKWSFLPNQNKLEN